MRNQLLAVGVALTLASACQIGEIEDEPVIGHTEQRVDTSGYGHIVHGSFSRVSNYFVGWDPYEDGRNHVRGRNANQSLVLDFSWPCPGPAESCHETRTRVYDVTRSRWLDFRLTNNGATCTDYVSGSCAIIANENEKQSKNFVHLQIAYVTTLMGCENEWRNGRDLSPACETIQADVCPGRGWVGPFCNTGAGNTGGQGCNDCFSCAGDECESACINSVDQVVDGGIATMRGFAKKAALTLIGAGTYANCAASIGTKVLDGVSNWLLDELNSITGCAARVATEMTAVNWKYMYKMFKLSGMIGGYAAVAIWCQNSPIFCTNAVFTERAWGVSAGSMLDDQMVANCTSSDMLGRISVVSRGDCGNQGCFNSGGGIDRTTCNACKGDWTTSVVLRHSCRVDGSKFNCYSNSNGDDGSDGVETF